MNFYKKELIAGFIILGVSSYLFFIADSFKASFQGGLGPGFWPKLVLGLLVFLSIINLFSIFKKKPNNKKVEKETAIKKDYFKLYNSIILMILYVILINMIGFICLTPIFLILLFWILGYRKKILNPIIAVGIVILMVYVFPNVLYLMLPRGIGFFREISLIFY